MHWVTSLILLLAGCHLQPKFRPGLKAVNPMIVAAVQPPSLSWEECSKIDRNVIGWTATSVVLGVLGGSSGGLAASFSESTPRYITGSISAVLSVVGALGGFLGSVYSKQYATRCTTNTGGK